MKSDYQQTIVTTASAAKAYWALSAGMHTWWTKPDAPMKAVGDRSKFTFPPNKSYWTFEATELIPDKRVVMVCVDALHIHEGQPETIKTEWLNTQASWDIRTLENKTEITFVHRGLVPQLHCYEVCQAGWDYFFLTSLQAFLDTGVGRPHQ